LPYDASIRAQLSAALALAPSVAAGAPVPAGIMEAERVLTDAHAEAVSRLLTTAGLRPGDIAYLGFHGQTPLHRPEVRRTWQIGDGVRLAQRTKIAVVNDFRSADVAAGGQGAPFVPLYHEMLTRGMERPVVAVNIGGVANVTYVGEDGALIAFDTGPGNAPIDDWALRHTGSPVDRDGAVAQSGHVYEAILRA